MNLPVCSVRDISVRRGDVVIATHGRSFWVLDNVLPLRELSGKIASAAWLFAPREAVRSIRRPSRELRSRRTSPRERTTPNGAILDYYLKADASTPVAIEILDGKGDLVRRLASDDKPRMPDLSRIALTPDWVAPAPPPPARRACTGSSGTCTTPGRRRSPPSPFGAASGPRAPPGLKYTVRPTAAGQTLTQPLAVVRDPRTKATDADLAKHV
jgi:hypothetical protein